MPDSFAPVTNAVGTAWCRVKPAEKGHDTKAERGLRVVRAAYATVFCACLCIQVRGVLKG